MSGNLTDKNLEMLLSVNAHCVFGALDDVVKFEDCTKEMQELIVKVATKSIEVSTVVTCSFFRNSPLDIKKLSLISEAIQNKEFDKANDLLAKNE